MAGRQALGCLSQPEKRNSFAKTMADAVPLGWTGQPEEVASAAPFPASNASSFITGVNLRVDGGMSPL
jgi:NAD(P)-dependent dehydrogenase (short-subunit alcohol dehydrogenase family)